MFIITIRPIIIFIINEVLFIVTLSWITLQGHFTQLNDDDNETIIQGGPKSKPPPIFQKIVLNTLCMT